MFGPFTFDIIIDILEFMPIVLIYFLFFFSFLFIPLCPLLLGYLNIFFFLVFRLFSSFATCNHRKNAACLELDEC